MSEKFENNTLRVKYQNQWHDLTIPEGMYEVRDLSDCINKLVVNGTEVPKFGEKNVPKILEIGVDRNTFHCVVTLQPGVEIDFSGSKLHELLGLEPKVYSSNEKGKTCINITRGVNDIMIRCNLVEREFQYEYKDVLFDMLPGTPGNAIMHEIENPIEFYKCKNRNIRSINIKITDQKGKLLLLNESAQIKLIFKHVEN